MKKLLKFCALFGAISVTTISSMSVIACSNEKQTIDYLSFSNYENYTFRTIYQEKLDVQKLMPKYDETKIRYLDLLNANRIEEASASQLQNDFNFMQNFLMKEINFEAIMFGRGMKTLDYYWQGYIFTRFDSDQEAWLSMMHVEQLVNDYIGLVDHETQLQKTSGFSKLKVNQKVYKDFRTFVKDWNKYLGV